MKTARTVCYPANDYEISSGGMTGFECLECHMPHLAKSSLAHAPVGTGPATGDIRTHVFRIDLTQEEQFTADGAFAYPWIIGEFAGKTCHNDETAFDLVFPSTMTIHDNS